MSKRSVRFFAVTWLLLCGTAAFSALPEPENIDILSVVPGAVSARHINEPVDCYRLFDAEGNSIGAAALSTSIPPKIAGYRGEIALLVGVDEKGKVSGLKLLSHSEGRSQMERVLSSDFLLKFLKRDPKDAWPDIEAVTGATISSIAMRDDIRATAVELADKIIAGGVLSKRAPASKWATGAERFITWANLAALLLIALSIVAVKFPHKKVLRNSSLFLSFIFVGLVFNAPLTIGNFMAFGYGTAAMFMVFAVVSALVKGPLYCSYLCPFGAMQDAASAVGLPKCEVGEGRMKYARHFRWLVLAGTLVAVLVFNVKAMLNVEPFSLCFAKDAGSAVWVQTGVILAAALFVRRPWCRLFCPTGLVIETLSKISVKVRCRMKCK